jgi:hypothetical protein
VETACINSQTSDSRNSFATISALSASRTLPPHAAIASSAAVSSRSTSACGLGATLADEGRCGTEAIDDIGSG